MRIGLGHKAVLGSDAWKHVACHRERVMVFLLLILNFFVRHPHARWLGVTGKTWKVLSQEVNPQPFWKRQAFFIQI